MTVILAIGAFQALFFAIILLNRKPAFRANKILAIWLTIVCLHLVINYAEAIGYYRQLPHLIGVTSSFLLLYGPLLFLYVKDFAGKSRKYDLLHFGVFMIEKMKLEGWDVEDSVKGKGEMDNNQYSVEVLHYSGDNIYRLIYIDVNGRETRSEEMNFYSLLPPIRIDPGEKVDKWIYLSRETDYQIFNEEDELVMKGFDDDINVSSLPYGNFEIIIENEPFAFYRLKPDPIPRIRKKKKKGENKTTRQLP